MGEVTTATVEVQFLEYNLVVPNPPIHVFIYKPSTLKSLTAAPSGTPYTVIFHLESNIPGATLSAENSIANTPPSGVTVTGSGSDTLILTFTNTGITGQTLAFNYTLTVTAGGQTYISDDPEIEIPPPT